MRLTQKWNGATEASRERRGCPAHFISKGPVARPLRVTTQEVPLLPPAWAGAEEGGLWVDTEEVFGRSEVSFWRLFSPEVSLRWVLTS